MFVEGLVEELGRRFVVLVRNPEVSMSNFAAMGLWTEEEEI